MTLVAALCWFDEPPVFLRRLVLSLDGLADELVAVDGRWRHHGDGTYSVSPREQLDAIRDTAAEVGLHAKVVVREIPWETQVQKRAWMMSFAEHCGDWVLVVDGDTYLEEFDSAPIHTALEQTRLDVAEVTVRNLNRPWPYEHLAPQTVKCRMLYRAGAHVVGPAHNDYVREGRRLNGDPARGALADALDLSDLLVVGHDNRNRCDRRNAAAAAYRRARRAHSIEVQA